MDSSKFNYEQYISSQQTYLIKTILIQSLQTSERYKYAFKEIPYDSQNRQIDIGKILTQIFFQILLNHYQYHVFYFNKVSGYYHFAAIYPFKQKLKLGQDFFVNDQIRIAFRKSKLIHFNQSKSINNQNNLTIFQSNLHEQFTSNSQNINKKKRINDRTIYQILSKVSLWRTKCEVQKITYQQAAKHVDIPKKTLDDYYSLIRQGQQYQFNFEKYLHQKIGVLRQFVKQIQKKQNIIKKTTTQTMNVSIVDKIITSLQHNSLYNNNKKPQQQQ